MVGESWPPCSLLHVDGYTDFNLGCFFTFDFLPPKSSMNEYEKPCAILDQWRFILQQ